MLHVLNELVKAIESREPVVLATVINVQGASPPRVGFKLLVRADGTYVGNMGGGELEKRVRRAAEKTLANTSTVIELKKTVAKTRNQPERPVPMWLTSNLG